jgi:DNA-binding NtrC family response regulator
MGNEFLASGTMFQLDLENQEYNMTYARILLVDDEMAFVDTMTKRLLKRDLEVVTAFQGEQALEKLKLDSRVDVVILDVKMPGKGGIETLKEIKAKYPLIEVIMLTGHATVESAIQGLKMGAFDYLMKPCEMDILLTKILEAKSKKSKHEEKIIEARMRELSLRHGS